MKRMSSPFLILAVLGVLLGIFVGCGSETSSLTTAELEGVVNLRMQVVTQAPYGYSSAPKSSAVSNLITDPVKDAELMSCAVIISKLSLYSGNKEHVLFKARYREDGAVMLIDNSAGEQVCNMVSSAPERAVNATSTVLKAENISWITELPEGDYQRMEMTIEEVCVTYKTLSGTKVNWHDKSFNKLVRLEAGNQFSPFKISRNSTKELLLKFNLSGRVGKNSGQFEPDVYLIGVN